MKSKVSLLTAAIVASAAIVSPVTSHAEIAADFVADFVKIEGLQRVSPEVVYAELPIAGGDEVTPQITAQAIKQLYDTGYFSDVTAYREGSQLIMKVVERPVITKVTFEGNSLVPTKALKEGFAQAGIKKGEPLKAYLLAKVEKDLEQQYLSRGRYNAQVVFDKKIAANNTVALTVKFYEGEPAKIVDIKVIGNKHFTKKQIAREFAVNETDWLSFFDKKDRFAQQKLAASLEGLRALYLNAGYINFAINDAIVNISEDKKNVFIEVSIDEGEQYQFGNTQFLGDPKYADDKLAALADIKPSSLFSQKQLTEGTQRLERLYGNAGYFFAKVRPVPRINEAEKSVDIDFYIDPGRPVYVRRINFVGNTKTEDHVLRREMRQLEGSLASNEKIDLSKVRLQRTGYFKSVNMQTMRVPGVADKIDINVTVEEQPSGSTTLAAGYSQSGGITFQAGLTQTNFFGTGNAVDIQLSRSDTVDNYNIGVTDPYFTVDGVSQSANVYYRKTKVDNLNINNYLTDSLGGRLSYGYPVDENTRLSAGIGIDKTRVKAGNNIAISNLDYLLDNGVRVSQSAPTKSNTATGLTSQLNRDTRFQSDYTTYNLNFSWVRDTLNRPVFPTDGYSHRVNAEVAVPGSDVSYQKVTYSGSIYQPLGSGFVARGYTKLGYGHKLPFYKHFAAGGFGTLRGYENGKIGPTSDAFIFVNNALTGGTAQKDPSPEYVGGNALAQAGVELVLPLPFEGDWKNKIRTVLFAEGAQVFDTTKRDKQTFENTGVPLIRQDNELRYAAGASMTWLTPIGPISLSYAKPLNKKVGDKTQSIQFEIGRIF